MGRCKLPRRFPPYQVTAILAGHQSNPETRGTRKQLSREGCEEQKAKDGFHGFQGFVT
jgi:hypothetical protein